MPHLKGETNYRREPACPTQGCLQLFIELLSHLVDDVVLKQLVPFHFCLLVQPTVKLLLF